jgi:membrane protease YdiL (CAAX protease family)
MDMTQDTGFAPDPGSPPPAPRGSVRGWVKVSWVVIVLVIAGRMMLPSLLPEEEVVGGDPVGEMLIGMQARYMVGATEFMGSGDLMYAQAGALNVGSLGQRLRFVVLAAELAGPAEAHEVLEGVRQELDERREAVEVTPEEIEVLRILGTLYPEPPPADAESDGDDPPAAPVAVELSTDDRALLVEQLGWFGELALSPRGTDDTAARDAVIGAAQGTFVLIIGAFCGAGLVGLLGFAGLVTLFVLALFRRLGPGIGPGGPHHGVYAETFAVWLVLFIVLQAVAGLAAPALGGAGMLAVVAGFFLSLGALAWPVMRGIPWSQVRREIGLTAGRTPSLEPIIGLGGYAMTLPILAVGVAITFVFLMIDTAMAGPPVPFAPASGPAHPIVSELGSGNWGLLLQVLLLGSVAAPIVEETMFRGVLYRHLRDGTAQHGLILSVLLASAVNAFVFASIHPQGWVAWPALMSLAIAFTLAREWRGTVVPAMVMHGVSNGLVLSLIAGLSAA